MVDTSVWVELLNGRRFREVSEEDLLKFVTCGPILQEVLQGLGTDDASRAFGEVFLAVPVLSDPLPRQCFLSAAEIYRLGRSKGYTIRSSTDCLIAAIAIANDVQVWHRDRDYDAIAQYTALEVKRLG